MRWLGVVVILCVVVATAAAEEVGHTCVRGARTYTCPDGSVLDVCDLCPGSSSSSSSSATSARPIATQSFEMNLIGGPGYLTHGDETSSRTFTGGLEGAITIGKLPAFGIGARAGLHVAHVPNAQPNGDAKAPLLVPVLFHLTLAPRISERVRFEIGGAAGMEFGGDCSTFCGAGILFQIHSNLVIYAAPPKRDEKWRVGFAIGVVREFRRGDGETGVPGLGLIRIGVRGRNDLLSW